MSLQSDFNFDVDFVIPWVDGSDKRWQKELTKYKYGADDYSTLDLRYRDMGILKYWFRFVEMYAPWVRKIFFVTEGHVPEWLNLDNPKLVHVKHKDYIPSEYLPVFSSHPIEINFHRIDGLSEHFVYFNDDMFLLKNIDKDLFFDKTGLPRDAAVMNAISGDKLTHIAMNNIELINSVFSKHSVIKNNLFKWFNYKYGKENIRNILLMLWPQFTGFLDFHLPNPYLKQTYMNVWSEFEGAMKKTSASKFRCSDDINQYIFRYWQLVSGQFSPIAKQRLGVYAELSGKNNDVFDIIKNDRFFMACFNDADIENFEEFKIMLNTALEKKAPNKSSFEK